MCLEQTGEVARSGNGFGKTKKAILACGIVLGIGMVLFGLLLLKRRKSRSGVTENIEMMRGNQTLMLVCVFLNFT